MIEKLFSRFGYEKRRFAAAKMDRTTSDWVLSTVKTNDDIKQNLETLRMRSRDLSKNNSDYRKWLSMRRKNIFGDHGLRLRMKVRNPSGEQDTGANTIIEGEFAKWGRKFGGGVSVDGLHSWNSFCELADRVFAVDGEAIIRKVTGYGGWLFSLQLIDPVLLDIGYNLPRTQYQNEIVMGVERDAWEKPVAYHFLQDVDAWGTATNRIRIPADEIIHLFRPEFVGQARGFPLAAAAILDMNMSAGYREAELIAARVAACQMGIWERPANATGKMKFDEKEQEKLVVDMEPGKFGIGPGGWVLKQLNPTHPGQNLPSFLKTIMRSISSGLDVSYNEFANDLEGVNFSSLRAGTLSERDSWKMDQQFFIETFCMPVFASWLTMLLLSGKTNLPLSKFDKFFQPVFVPRRWDWVDPLKDIKAHSEAIDLRISAPQEVIEAAGRDPEEVLEMIAQWNTWLKEYNITPPQPKTPVDKNSLIKKDDTEDEEEQ